MKKLLLFCMSLLLLGQPMHAQRYFQTRWQNIPRNYFIYLPKNFSPSEHLPLVINMHGFTTTAAFQMDYSQFNHTADTARCIAIYPEGVDLRWNSGTFFFVSSTVDDVGFLGDLMDRAALLFNADMKKVYAMGYSAGGFMSYKLACDASNRVAAIAPDVGSMVFDNLNSCVPARPMNISAFNGYADPITSYNGIPGNFPGIDSIKHFWQIKNGCDAEPLIDTLPDLKNDGTRVVRYTYQHCSQDVQQVFYKVLAGGHTWPGAADIFAGILGKTTQDVGMNNQSWGFFKDKEIPAAVQCDAPANLQAVAVASDSFQLSWDAVPGVAEYKIGLADDSDHVSFFQSTLPALSVKIDPARMVRWNVASLCSSGFHNWNTTRPLNFTSTGLRNPLIGHLALYPNPVHDLLHVSIPENLDASWQISVFNVLGEELRPGLHLVRGDAVDVGSLSPGFYRLLLFKGNKTYAASFVRQ